MIKLTAQFVTLDAAQGEAPSRTITGLAVPWDTPAVLAGGQTVSFLRGSIAENGPAPKLLEYHDDTRVIGLVTALADSEQGLIFEAKIANTTAGNDALELLKMGALDSVSVGAVPIKFTTDREGTMLVSEARMLELSIVTVPAYADAQVHSVAASQPDEEIVEAELTPIPTEEKKEMTTENIDDAVPTAPLTAAIARREFKLPSAGEYMVKFLAGGSEFVEFNSRIRAAAPDVVTTDLPGILPVPIVGPIYNNFMPNYRPLITAMGVKSMPASGKVWIRPKVTTNTTIGLSNGENQPLDQGTFVVDDIQVTKALYGGYVLLSEESIDMSSPEVLGALLDDMARVYANQTDAAACDTFENAVTQTQALTLDTDPADWVSFIYGAAEQILNNSNGNLPNVLIMSPAYYAKLGALVDGSNRPLFPNVGPQNALGTTNASNFNGNAFGLNLVVDRNLVLAGGKNLFVGASDGFECWEAQKGALSVQASDGSLSRTIAFRGYFSAVMLDDTKFVTRA